jgi:hypothetical protein
MVTIFSILKYLSKEIELILKIILIYLYRGLYWRSGVGSRKNGVCFYIYIYIYILRDMQYWFTEPDANHMLGS